MREVGLLDRVKLFSFSEGGVNVHGDWTRRAMLVVRDALALPRGGRTAVADALLAAAAELPFAPRKRQALVLVSDGIDNASEASAEDVIDVARRLDAPVYVLAVGGEARRIQEKREEASPLAPLRAIARQTGGRFFLVSDREKSEEAAKTIRQDLRHQYWLAFTPSSPPDGRFRPIEVRARDRSLNVHARRGYE
jgi:VWFA-related protein